MRETVLLVFAKEPRPGEVKTRLSPPLSDSQAARCQQAFLEDSLRRLRTLTEQGVALTLVATPEGDCPWLEQLAERGGAGLLWQGAGDLGQRMHRAMQRECSAGRGAVILGSDSPDLPLDYVRSAIESLRSGRIVIGPSDDGGYYLIAAAGEVPPVFALGCDWGSSQVFEESVSKLEAVGCDYQVLPRWPDVDRFADLRGLAARLASDASPEAGDARMFPRETQRVLAQLVSEGVAL